MSSLDDVNELLAEHAKQICETLGLDSVQILSTHYNSETGFTDTCYGGYGNWYSRFGAAKEYVVRQEQAMKPRPQAPTEPDEESSL